MRALFFAVVLSLAAPAAWAEPVTVAPVVFEAEFQEKLTDEIGDREGAVIEEIIGDAVARATANGPAGLKLSVTVVDAQPNRPTFHQLSENVGLDFGRSFGVGGANLRGVLTDADGRTIAEISHRYYETDIEDAAFVSTWHDVRRAAYGFARKVAAASRAG